MAFAKTSSPEISLQGFGHAGVSSIIATVKTDLIAKCYKTDNCEKAIEYVLLNMQCIHDVYFYTQYSQQ